MSRFGRRRPLVSTLLLPLEHCSAPMPYKSPGESMQIRKIIVGLLFMAPSLLAAQVPFEFSDGNIAKAAEVNANFSHLMQEIERSRQHFWSAQDEYQVDCTLDDTALETALVKGHINILIVAGSCDARGLTSRPVLSIRGATDTGGNKLATLDTKGELLDLSGFTSNIFYFKDLIFKGALRSGASWGWLGNVDLICDVTSWKNYFGAIEQNFALFSYGGSLGLSNSSIRSDSGNLCQGLTALGPTYTQNVTIEAGQGIALVANPGSSILASKTAVSTRDNSFPSINMLQSKALFFGESEVQLPFVISTDSSITFAGTILRSNELNSSPTVINVGSEMVLSGITPIEGVTQIDVTDSVINILIGETADITLNLIRSAAGITIIPSNANGLTAVTARNNSEVRVGGNGLNVSVDLGFGSWLKDNTSESARVPSDSITCPSLLQKYSSLEEGLTCR